MEGPAVNLHFHICPSKGEAIELVQHISPGDVVLTKGF